MGELSIAIARPREGAVVALTLEAASRMPRAGRAPAMRVVTVSAGLVPSPAAASKDDEVRRFAAVFGDEFVTYWVSLGRDAATLARAAVRKLPQGTVTEPRGVAARRLQAKGELQASRATLWSTESAGFADLPAGGHTLKRTVCAVDVQSNPESEGAPAPETTPLALPATPDPQ